MAQKENIWRVPLARSKFYMPALGEVILLHPSQEALTERRVVNQEKDGEVRIYSKEEP
jgi:hypothetical protein